MPAKNSSNFIIAITAIAALGGFLFGFDMAVVSGIIAPVKVHYQLSDAQEGFFVSCALLGCMVGVGFSGRLSDKTGRKKVLFLAAILFLLSAVGFALSEDYRLLIVFRIMAGMGVGVASNISPLYISEMAPAKKRGMLVTFYQLAISIGILVAYISNFLLQRHAAAHIGEAGGFFHQMFVTDVWRGMFLVGILPALAFLLLLTIVPESPRWLVQYGQKDKARRILEKIEGEASAAVTLQAIEQVAMQLKGGLAELVKPPLFKLLVLAVGLTALSQFSGINGVIYYGPTIMKEAGIVTKDALWYQVILGAANTLFTIVAIAKVDSWGRRPLYLTGSICEAIALALAGLCFYLKIGGWPMLACIILFLLFFAFSLGPLKFVIATEIFPTHVRGAALSISIMTMWVSDWCVGLLFPILRGALGMGTTFFIFSLFCVCSFLFAKKYLFETKGQSLEEIEKQFIGH